MGESAAIIEAALSLIRSRGESASRVLVALAGPPGAGKSTLVEPLAAALGPDAAVVPMDGFHYDDAVLSERGLLARKGAPETFDVEGLQATLARLRSGGRDVAVPLFDRAREMSRAAARVVPAAARYVIVEGNYLLLDEAPWRDVAACFDIRLFIAVPRQELRDRLIRRWLVHGLSAEEARRKAEGNDLVNADRVASRRLPCHLALGSNEGEKAA